MLNLGNKLRRNSCQLIKSFSFPEGMEARYTHAVGAYALIKKYRSAADTPKSPAMSCLLNRFAKLLMASYPLCAIWTRI